MIIIQYLTFAAVIIAFIAMFVKAFRYIKAPTHFRWELYPVPHEKGRADYGGSYLEELDWWSKPRHSDKLRELKEMMSEILFLKGVYHHNRRVWVSSFPFHLGMYLCIAWLVLLLLGSILQISGLQISTQNGIYTSTIHYLTIFSGYVGLVLSGLGALGLLQWRMFDKDQRRFNSPAEYINLLIFIVVVVITLFSQFSLDANFSFLRGYVQSLLTLNSPVIPGTIFSVEIIAVSLLIMYIPLTRMSHFVAKYFLYHSVRWNDEPNERGSKIEKDILELLKQKVAWQGAHIQTGKPWTDVVKEMSDEQK
jgi:nitrate reductase gamma subunit